jgi:hypothetical protein
LCEKFNTGRVVRTRQQVSKNKNTKLNVPEKIWIISNPTGDLKNAEKECDAIFDAIKTLNSEKLSINPEMNKSVSQKDVKYKIRNYDMVHFAGHAEYDPELPDKSGWKCSDKIFSAKNVTEMAGTDDMPDIIFSNACHSAISEKWKVDEFSGLANAFLTSGVSHYIGTFWKISDKPGSYFAIYFYQYLMSGLSIGEAMRLARIQLLNVTTSKEAIICSYSYILYGDPRVKYFEKKKQDKKIDENTNWQNDLEAKSNIIQRSNTSPIVNNFVKTNKLFTIFAVLMVILVSYGIYYYSLNKPEYDSKIVEMLITNDRQKQKDIQELIGKIKKNIPMPNKVAPDDWTSVPLTIVISFDSLIHQLNEYKENMLLASISKKIQDEAGFQPLERKNLFQILNELYLGISIGKQYSKADILTPSYFLFISMDNEHSNIVLRLTDASRRHLDFFYETIDQSIPIIEQSSHLWRTLIQKLQLLKFPLKAKIVDIKNKQYILNIGHREGARPGQKFVTTGNGQEIVIQLEEVEEHTSYTAFFKEYVTLQKGCKVKSLSIGNSD